MIRTILLITALSLSLANAQDQPPQPAPASPTTTESLGDKAREAGEALKDKAREAGDALKDKTREITTAVKDKATTMAESEEGQKATASILEWVQSAEALYRPWINWVLVAVGIALFVSHVGQLIIGKLWGLVRGRGFSLAEVINDFLVAGFAGLALPAVLLIPVGNKAFISMPLAVLSSAAVGILVGMFLYTHGVRQEMQAAKTRQED